MQIADTEHKVTTNLAAIRDWVTGRHGVPVRTKQGRLLIQFSDKAAGTPISWEEFETQFNQQGLAFIYQETTISGQISKACKLVRR